MNETFDLVTSKWTLLCVVWGREFMWIRVLLGCSKPCSVSRENSWVYQRFAATSSVLIIIKSFQLPSHPAPDSGLESDWISCFSPTSTPWGRWISDVKSYDSHTAVVHHYTRHARQIEKLFPGKPGVSAVTQCRRTSPELSPSERSQIPFFSKSHHLCVDWKMNGGKAKKQRKTFHHSTTGKTLSNQERLNMIKISSQAFHVCMLVEAMGKGRRRKSKLFPSRKPTHPKSFRKREFAGIYLNFFGWKII